LLRFIKSVDLSVFYQLIEVVKRYREGVSNDHGSLTGVEKPKDEEVRKVFKGLFMFPERDVKG
jgi:hypothetical protein